MLTLDASGGAARQRVLVVGDQSRCQLAGKSSAPELQEVRGLVAVEKVDYCIAGPDAGPIGGPAIPVQHLEVL